MLLTGAEGAGIAVEDNGDDDEDDDDDDDEEEDDDGDVSEVKWSVDFVGVDDTEGSADGAGGAPMGVAGLELQLGLPPLLAMIEFKCIEDLLASEGSFSEAFLGSGLQKVDSISIVVSGPVPREHWNSTRLMMRATCWSRMWLMTRPRRRCSCCRNKGRLSGCLAKCNNVPAARRSMSKLVPMESGLSRR